MSLGGSGVSIGGVGSLRVKKKFMNHMGVEPKIKGNVPPNHPFYLYNRVFHEIFTIHFGCFPPIFGNTHIYIYIYHISNHLPT